MQKKWWDVAHTGIDDLEPSVGMKFKPFADDKIDVQVAKAVTDTYERGDKAESLLKMFQHALTARR